MAVRKKPKLQPIASLNPEQRARRRFARSIGMKDETQLDRFVKRMSNLDPSDPRYLRPDLPPERFESTIRRLYQKDKKTLTPWREIVRKKEKLVDELGKMSNFTFNEKYKQMIEAALKDPNTSKYGKTQLRKLRAELARRSSVPSNMAPEKNGQGRLF